MTKTAVARVLSDDPTRAMHEMMGAIDALKIIYIRETEALNAADASKFFAMQEEKIEAARKYQEGVEDLLSRKEQIKAVSPTIKNRLAAVEKEFSELSEKNVEALKRMRRSAERLGETIMSAAKDAARQKRAVAYGETGAFKSDDKKTVSMGVSETA